MTLRCHVEHTALELLKTLFMSNDQQELIERAESYGQTTAFTAAAIAFDFAEAFHRVAEARRIDASVEQAVERGEVVFGPFPTEEPVPTVRKLNVKKASKPARKRR